MENLKLLCLCGNALEDGKVHCEECEMVRNEDCYDPSESDTNDCYPEDTPLFYDYYGGE